MTGVMPSPRVYGTWCRHKYYHHLLSNHISRNAKVVTKHITNQLSRNCLFPHISACKHSTEVPQTSKWEKPLGYDSKVKVYHPILKEKLPLILLQDRLAQWYACGPTVYDSSHIGHASSYVRLDIIRRILSTTFNINTFLVMGVTDIDDKIIQRSSQTGQSLNELTRHYESEFFTSLHKLNVSPPSLVVRVTDHINQIIDFISGIEAKGMAYRTTNGSVYFDVSQYGNYGVFVGGANQGRVTEVDIHKKSPQDFALWKANKPGEPSWPSPWGPGRPGWHIECSAMASKVFGANFDIHTGGEDLAFPHHENELAQSCIYHNKSQWANYWIHTGHLFVSGECDKMSKSLKNVISVAEFLQDYSPDHFRMLCLLNHYRNRIEFSHERMDKAVSTITTLKSLIDRCHGYTNGQVDCVDIPEAEFYEKLYSTRRAVEAAYADDFNTPNALANLIRLVKFTNQFLGDQEHQTSHVRSVVSVSSVGQFVESTLEHLGLKVTGQKMEVDTEEKRLQFNKIVDSFVSLRTQLRQFAKDEKFFLTSAEEGGIPKDQAIKLMKKLFKPLWKISDKIRADVLSSANIQIYDNDKGTTRWSVVHPKFSSVNHQMKDEDRDKQSKTKRDKESKFKDGDRQGEQDKR